MATASGTNPVFYNPTMTNGVVSAGIFIGAGAPSISAPQGSIYMNTTGSTIATRMYINTTGSTTWTAVSTVAQFLNSALSAEAYKRMLREEGKKHMDQLEKDRQVTVKAYDFFVELLKNYKKL